MGGHRPGVAHPLRPRCRPLRHEGGGDPEGARRAGHVPEPSHGREADRADDLVLARTRSGSMTTLTARAAFEAYLTALTEQDLAALDALIHPDFEDVYPQSGERVRGAANLK